MKDVTLISTNLGKLAFHVCGQDRHRNPRLCRKFSRKQLAESFATFNARKAVMGACDGAHYTARQLNS